MAAYVKQADQVALILSKAEASALLELALNGEDKAATEAVNNSTASARNRAVRALEVACNPGSRVGAAYEGS